MGTDFVLQVKCTIFWLDRGLRVFLDLYVPDFPKSTPKYFLYPSTFIVQNTLFWRCFWLKKHPNHVKPIFAKILKYDAFNLRKKVSAHALGLVVQLS